MQRTQAQQAVIDNRGGTLLVAAAAGSGKTSVLVDRLIDRIDKDGLSIDQFLIITFTKAAAEELRLRIGRTLAERLQNDPENRHLQRQGILLYRTQISTIHAFCSSLLREWGHSLSLPVDFVLCEESQAVVLMEEALRDCIEARYEQMDTEGDFAQLLDVLSAGRDDQRLLDIVMDVYAKVQSHPDPLAWLQTQKDTLALTGITDVAKTPWGKLLFAHVKRELAYWQREMQDSCEAVQEDEQLQVYGASFEGTYNALVDASLCTTWDEMQSAFPIPFPRLKIVRNCENVDLQTQVKRVRDRCKEAMEDLGKFFWGTSEVLLADMQALLPAMYALLDLVEDFAETYEAVKQRKHLLDFADLEHKALSLLVDSAGQPTEIARQTGKRFAEIMVDEYQDTNKVQNDIFSALSQDAENLFFVGDIKQSIYRFRLADPSIFLGKYQYFMPYERAIAGESRKILLSQNFRSRPEVLDAVNFLFYQIMSEDMGEMAYTEQEALYAGGTFPEGAGYETEFHVLYLDPEQDKRGKVSHTAMEARFVAKRIADMLREGFLVSDGQGGTRPVQAEDIVILLRSPSRVLPTYVKALQSLNIPCHSSVEDDFFQSTEIAVLLSYLQIIDNPRQDVPLLAVLHSPLYAFDGEDLANLRLAGGGDIYDALCAAAQKGDSRCVHFLEQLEQLRFEAVDLSCHALLWKLFDLTDALEVFAQMPAGELRQAHLLTLYDLACRFERAGYRGLFRFLFYLAQEQEKDRGLLGAGVQEQAGVQVLSIHKSKGLEFPVVFLCGLSKRFNLQDMKKPMLFHPAYGLGAEGRDNERDIRYPTLPRVAIAHQLKRELFAEEMRLLYVAMTRAKEKLMLVHTLQHSENELKQLASSLASPLAPSILARCGSVGQWILFSAMLRPEGKVLRDVAQMDSDPAKKHLGRAWQIVYHTGTLAEGKPLAEKRTEAQLGTAPLHETALAERLCWVYPHAGLSRVQAKLTATDLIQRETFAQTEGEIPLGELFRTPRFATEEQGLTPAQRGTALHTALQHLDFSQSKTLAQIEAQIARLQEKHYLTAQEAQSISSWKLLQFCQSDLGQRLQEAERVHREFPFSMLLPAEDYHAELAETGEQVLFQGVIDCWFAEADGITLIDFKSNFVTQENAEKTAEGYRPQINAYAKVLERLTGQPVLRQIVWFLGAEYGVDMRNA